MDLRIAIAQGFPRGDLQFRFYCQPIDHISQHSSMGSVSIQTLESDKCLNKGWMRSWPQPSCASAGTDAWVQTGFRSKNTSMHRYRLTIADTLDVPERIESIADHCWIWSVIGVNRIECRRVLRICWETCIRIANRSVGRVEWAVLRKQHSYRT